MILGVDMALMSATQTLKVMLVSTSSLDDTTKPIAFGDCEVSKELESVLLHIFTLVINQNITTNAPKSDNAVFGN